MTTRRPIAQSGQTLPLFAVMLPGMLLLMALGLDAAQVFLERRDAQGAADLAALAGVQHLDDTDGITAAEQDAARAAATAIGVANGYAASQVIPITPYDGDDTSIEVTIDSSVRTFFLPILGVLSPGDHSTMDVSARAVAEHTVTAGTTAFPFALFALEGCPSDQKSVDVSGSTSIYGGRVHSNSDVYVSGSDHLFGGGTTHTCPDDGDPYEPFYDGGGGNDFDPGPTTGPYWPDPEPDPVAKTIDDFECDHPSDVSTINAWSGQPHTYSGDWDLAQDGDWWLGGSKSSKRLLSGTYCSDGRITLGDSDIGVYVDEVLAPGVTFAAQTQVKISGSQVNLTAHEREDVPILIYSEGDSDVAIEISGSGNILEGIMYAPNGTAVVSGQDAFSYTGGIVGERVKFNGSDGSLSAAGGEDSPSEKSFALKE